jgi:hypothetical protein
MVNRQFDAVAELQNALSILFKNWILVVPTALASLLAAAVAIFLGVATFGAFTLGGLMGGFHAGAAMGIVGSILLALFVMICAYLIAAAVVIAAAENIWHGQPADLAAGFSKALGMLGGLIVLLLVWLVVCIICLPLSILAGLGLLILAVLGFLWMYALPAMVLGHEAPLAALGTSYRLVRSNLSPSVTAFVAIVAVNIIGLIINHIFHFIPPLFLLASLVISGLTSAYAALVAVRFYDLLRSASPAAQGTGPTA